MSSTLTINFSLRQNKAIERAIAFDALSMGREFLGEHAVYIGLGSLWFQDFQMAHRLLGVETMVSIEGNESVYSRAEFNAPLRTKSRYPGGAYFALTSVSRTRTASLESSDPT